MMTQQRLISLDMLRGLAMAGMILVNNPGSWSHIYVPLEHSVWNGLTPTDLVFPFFVFAMGMAMGFSTKGLTASRASYLRKVMKRSVLLFVIGLLLTLLGRWLNTGELCFSQLRVMGVLQRLSLSYLAVVLIVRRVKSVPTMTFMVVALLSGYWLLLMLGHGFDFSANNIVAIVDRWLLGENHLYIEHLPDGTPIAECARCLDTVPEAAAIGLNCTAPQHAEALIGAIRKETDKPIVVYPNSGETYDAADKSWHGTAEDFGTMAQRWHSAGARLIGGCCRTTPREIAEIAAWAKRME